MTVVNARTGSVTLVDTRTGQVIRFQAEPTGAMGPQNGVGRVGVNALKVGDTVDLIGGQLQTGTGATIEGRVQR